MTNETTASQPKSIGDDAQFPTLLGNLLDAAESGDDAYDSARAALVAMIDGKLRAPADQASATIQAVQGDFTARDIEVLQGIRVIAVVNDRKFRSWEASKEMAVQIASALNSAATIQEPVMVAEPADVEDGDLPDCPEGYMVKLANEIKSWETLPEYDEQKGEVDGERWCLACDKLGHRTDECWSTHGMNTPQDRELMRLCHAAAPMVADPAGVTWTDIASYPEFHHLMTEYRNAEEPKSNAAWFKLVSLINTLAATVKAVPSEALAKRNEQAKFEEWSVRWKYNLRPANEDSADTYMEGETETAWMGWMACVDSFAAPQADKTGGGE